MIWFKKYGALILICSFLVFDWGLLTWFMARHYEPQAPVMIPARHYKLPKPTVNYPLARYQSLFSGSLFLGENMAKRGGGFQSRLVLWGLINNGLAVVGVEPGSNQNTWIVKAGDTVEGEKIVTVGVRYIVVRNQTGEGKVMFNQ